jgi:hypothetical protein
MAWTTPKTWNVDELLTAANLNTHLRDNLNALKAPPTVHYECDEDSEYTTTSTSFVDVDGTNLALTLTTSAGKIFFDVTLDGNRIGEDDGILGGYVQNAGSGNTASAYMSFTRLVTGMAAGEHTFVLQWRTTGSTARLFAGATAAEAVHPQFWAREVS